MQVYICTGRLDKVGVLPCDGESQPKDVLDEGRHIELTGGNDLLKLHLEVEGGELYTCGACPLTSTRKNYRVIIGRAEFERKRTRSAQCSESATWGPIAPSCLRWSH